MLPHLVCPLPNKTITKQRQGIYLLPSSYGQHDAGNLVVAQKLPFIVKKTCDELLKKINGFLLWV